MKQAIISDLDGTLAVLHGRTPFNPKSVLEDKLNPAPALILRTFYETQSVVPIVVSGRFEKYRDETFKWFSQNNLGFIKDLYLRPADDFRKDYTYKKDIFDKHIKNKFEVLFCMDDRDQSVDFWRSLGLTCLQVAPGSF